MPETLRHTPVISPRRSARRRSDGQAELVERHRTGAFKKELARDGIHVETVRAIIARRTTNTN